MIVAIVSPTNGTCSIEIDNHPVMLFTKDYYRFDVKKREDGGYQLVVVIPSANWGTIEVDKIE